VIFGVDTHRGVHVAAILTIVGVLLANHSCPTTRDGYAALLVWANSLGDVNAASVECTGLYGSALMKCFQAQSMKVFEVNQSVRALRRKAGKVDAVDAEATASAVIAGRSSAMPKTGIGAAEELRQMRLVKSSAAKARTTAINQLEGPVVGAGASTARSALWTQHQGSQPGLRPAAAQPRRTSEDRCLKRHLAREIFAILKALPDQNKDPAQHELTT
jgi:hypothetical protein